MKRKDKIKLGIFIVAVIIPFGVMTLLVYYSIRYFLFKKPFTEELELIKGLLKNLPKNNFHYLITFSIYFAVSKIVFSKGI